MSNTVVDSIPIAIGGIGGSGTRVVATILKDTGRYMGGDLNHPIDNLWFTLFFKQLGIRGLSEAAFKIRVDHFVAAMTRDKSYYINHDLILDLARGEGQQHPAEWLIDRAKSYLNYKKYTVEVPGSSKWAWKEPNTHICIDRLKIHIPKLKYIHLIRHGQDMAFSQNLLQLAHWGEEVLGRPVEMIPRDALSYWVEVHKQLDQKLSEFADDEKLILKFEDLCHNPHKTIHRILEFCDVEKTDIEVDSLAKLVVTPKSLGRYKKHGASQFRSEDISALNRFGYS